MNEKLQLLQEKYGKPTVEEAIAAYYNLEQLKEMAKGIDYLHNFQRERRDIVRYVRGTHEILIILKEEARRFETDRGTKES